MKAFLFSVVLTGIARASFTYETPEEFSAQADFNGDGLPDVAVMDRTSGSIRILTSGNNGGFNISGVIHSGLDRPDAFSAGALPGSAGIVVSSLVTNEVLLITPQTARTVTLPLGTRSAPRGVAIPSLSTDSPGSVYIATDQNILPTPRRITRINIAANGAATLGGTPDRDSGAASPLIRGNALPWGTSRGMAFISREQGSASSALQIYRDGLNNGDSRTAAGLATGLPADALWLHGRFASSDSRTGILAYARGGSQVLPLEAAAAEIAVTSHPRVDLGGPIRLLVTVPFTAPTRDAVLAIFGEGERATLFGWQNGTNPVALQSWDAPPGKRFTRAAPLGGGSFLFMHGENGRSTGWARMDHDGSRHVQARTGSFPAAGLQRGAQIFLFTGEPFVDPAAKLWGTTTAPDWAMPGATSAVVLSDGGLRAGLGNPSPYHLPPMPGFAVMNQIWKSADGTAPFSLSVLSNRLGNVPAVIGFTPAAGDYSGEEMTVELRHSANPAAVLQYRLSANTPWTAYQGPITVTGPVTVFARAAGSNSVFSAHYSADGAAGLPPDLAVKPHPDLNGNGLPDFWENMFGQSDPTADTDGDGKTALQEYLAGTDPRDRFSVTPEPPVPAFALKTFSSRVGNRTMFHVRWPAVHGDAVLQGSANLGDWSRVTDGISPVGNDYLYTVPVSDARSRFFRLKSD